VIPIAAHMFVFYFGIISGITPPVALAAYAAAGIARSDPFKTGWVALRLGLSGFIIPFMFVTGPSLLLVGSVLTIVRSLLTATLGVIGLSAAIVGYGLAPLRRPDRIGLGIASLLLIDPGFLRMSSGSSSSVSLPHGNTGHGRRQKNILRFNRRHHGPR